MEELRKCHLCGSIRDIEKHHVFGGALRSKSEYYGMVVDLCHFCHNEPPNGVHHNDDNMLALKQEFQRVFENKYPYIKFVDVFYKNYL